MTKRKPSLRKPTHRLVHDGQVYAYVRCGKGGDPAIEMAGTGEVVRSASFLMDCDLLMGRWHNAVWHCFGKDGDHIPEAASLETI